MAKHEKLLMGAKYKNGDEVYGSYTIKKIGNAEYFYSEFKVIDVKRVEHEFVYALEPVFIRTRYTPHICYLGLNIPKVGDSWKVRAEDKEEFEKIRHLLVDRIKCPESNSGIMRESPVQSTKDMKKFRSQHVQKKTVQKVKFPPRG